MIAEKIYIVYAHSLKVMKGKCNGREKNKILCHVYFLLLVSGFASCAVVWQLKRENEKIKRKS